MPYCFRLRVQMTTPIANADLEEPYILEIPPFPSIEVTSQDAPWPRRWVIFKCCDYSSESEARAAGDRFREVLSLVGATRRLGVDVGFDRTTLQFSQAMKDAWENETGLKSRSDVHGLMTYEKDTLFIVSMSAIASTSISVQGFQELMGKWLANLIPLNERQRNSAALINDSLFVTNTEGKFVLCISAVEALCDQSIVGAEYQSVIQSLEDYLATLPSSQERETAMGVLKNARRESIRQAYMAKFKSHLTLADAKAFHRLYGLRSDLLHDGKGRGTLTAAAEEALVLAVRLLEAEVLNAKPVGGP